MRVGLGIVILAGLTGGVYLSYQFAGGPADASQAALVETDSSPGPTVTVAKAVRGSLEQSFSTYGNLIAHLQADIVPQIDGQIERILVEDGATVAQGQVILELDATVADAQLKSAEAKLEAAKADFQRAQTMVRRQVSRSLSLEEARVKLALAKTDMALKQEERRRYTIRAPFAGQIAQIAPSQGAQVTAGKPVSRIYDQNRLRVEFRAPERLWGTVKKGQHFAIRADGNPKLTATGQVSYVSPDADPRSRSLVVTGPIDNRDRHFAPGLFVLLRLDLGAKENAVLVPKAAVVERLSGSYLFVVEKDKSFERKVKLGERRDGKVEVLSGVTQGEQVVISGQKMIRDNMAVTVAQGTSRG